jgi:hypothetical protein
MFETETEKKSTLINKLFYGPDPHQPSELISQFCFYHFFWPTVPTRVGRALQ